MFLKKKIFSSFFYFLLYFVKKISPNDLKSLLDMLKNFLDDIPDDLLNTLDCPMDGTQPGVIKSEHIGPDMQHIKQESLTPMHLSPQRSDMQSPSYKPLIASDPLMASNFSPMPPMSSPSSTATMIPTAAPLQQKPLTNAAMILNRQHLAQQQQQQLTASNLQPMDTTGLGNGNGNLILQTNNVTSTTGGATPLQLSHLDINNQTIALTQVSSAAMSTIPSILYATTTNAAAANGGNNNAFILQAAAAAPQNSNNLIGSNTTPEKKVQISSNNAAQVGSTTQYKKIQSMPQVLTVQSLQQVAGTGNNNGGLNVPDKQQQQILNTPATIKVSLGNITFYNKLILQVHSFVYL